MECCGCILYPQFHHFFDANLDLETEKWYIKFHYKNSNLYLKEAGFNYVQIVPNQFVPSILLQLVHKISLKPEL